MVQLEEHLTENDSVGGLNLIRDQCLDKREENNNKTKKSLIILTLILWAAAVVQLVEHLSTDHEIKGLYPVTVWHGEKMVQKNKTKSCLTMLTYILRAAAVS